MLQELKSNDPNVPAMSSMCQSQQWLQSKVWWSAAAAVCSLSGQIILHVHVSGCIRHVGARIYTSRFSSRKRETPPHPQCPHCPVAVNPFFFFSPRMQKNRCTHGPNDQQSQGIQTRCMCARRRAVLLICRGDD